MMSMNLLRQSLVGASVNRGARALTSVPMRFRSYGGLSDQDRIFTNLYKDESPWIDGALKRGDWHNTKEILGMG